MAESTVVRNKRDIQVAYTDGTRTYTVAYEPGDFSLDIPLQTVGNYLDRGQMPTVPSIRLEDDQPMTFSHSVYERDWVSASDHVTMLDLAVRFDSQYADTNWTSTIGSASDAAMNSLSCNVTQDGASFGEADITMQLPYSVIRASRADGTPNTITITGTSYALRPTIL